MGSSKQVIRIDAEVNASLGNLNQVVTQLREGLSKGATQIDMSKGVGKSVSGLIRTFQTEYDEFSRLTKNGVLNMDDSGPAIASAKKLLRVFDELQDVMSGIESKDANALKKLFPNGFDKNISDLGKELDKVGQKIKNLSTAKTQKLGLEAEVERLQAELEQLKSKIAEPDQLDLNTQQAEQRLQRINKLIEDMRARAEQKIKINLEGKKEIKEKEQSNLSAQKTAKEEEVRRAQEAFNQTWGGYKFGKKDGRYTYDGKTQAEWESQIQTGSEREKDIARKAVKSLQNMDVGKYTRFEEASTSLNTKKQELAALEVRIQTISSEISNLQSSVAGLGNLSLGDLTELGKQAGLSPEQIERISKALQMQTTAQERLNQAQQAQADLPENQQAAEQKTADIEAKKKQIIDLEKTISGLKEKLDLSDLSKKLSELGIDISPDLLKSEEGAQQVREQLEKLDNEKLASVKKALQDLGITSKETQKNAEGAAKGIGKMDDEIGAVTRAERDMENLKNRMLDFFSLTNTVQLFKRAVTQAFNTVKELDAVMTETAVVTDFSVGDMWDKLPEYSAEANKLGASISSLYQATTLYYQQGLETQAAMGVGIETMKMARIAGMEATEATQAMTAALRGFNMEVNEMNATRVNDVYSELAAITAADTEQIATAMTKTASIAASANMEFETTAALLAQIIETTQEAPETAGTAMKTIIARFTEVKSLFSEGQLTGKDEEGEAIDINKIDKALSSVGISLKDFLNGQKGIDDIFLELASKWDTLDLATQRYIATTAAGSRQQSRFIAMMSDYGRTMELVSAANNSAGASQRQFDKTQESLEAKLQKLKNAWDQFTMGVANSDLIKGGVDMLTKILNLVNTLIDKISGGSGLIKGVLSLGAAWGGLALGNKALSGGLKFLSENSVLGAFFPNLKKLGDSAEGKDISGASKKTISEIGKTAWAAINKTADAIMAEGKAAIDTITGVSIASEEAEGAAAVEQEVLEGTVGTEQETQEGIVAVTQETQEGTVAVTQETQEGIVSIEQEMAEGATAVAQEVLEGTTGVAQEIAEGTVAVAQETVEGTISAAHELKEGLLSRGTPKPTMGGGGILGLLKTIAPYAAVAVATAAIIALIAYHVDRAIETDKEKRERLEKQVEYAGSKEKEVRAKRDNFKSDLSNFRQTEKSLLNLKRGTAEWREQLVQVNEQALSLIEKYPELKLETGAAGQLSISEESYNNFLKQQQEQLRNLNAIKASGNLDLEEMNYSDQLDKNRILRTRQGKQDVYSYQEGGMVKRDVYTWEDWTTGFSDDQIRNMMTAFAQQGINSTNLLSNKDIAKKIIMAQGVGETEATSLINKMTQLGASFDELSVASLQASIKMDTFADSFFTSASEDRKEQNISDEAATNFLELAYGGSQGLKERTLAKEQELLANSDDSALFQEYAKQMDYYYSGGKVYTDSSMKEVIEVTREGAASAIADSLIKSEATAAIDHLNLNTQQEREDFEKYFGSERANLSLAEARELEAEDLAALLGTSKELENNQDYRKGLEQYIEAIQTAAEVNQIETAKYFAKYKDSYEGQEITGDTYKDIIAKGHTLQIAQLKIPNFNELLTSAMQSVEKSGDNELANQVFDALTQTQNIANPKYFETASELISSIDWSNPIEAMDQISKAMENGDEITRDFASQLNALGSHFLGLGSQVQYFVESTDFTEMQGDIQKIIDKSGEFTGMDIMELADDYESLQKIIDNNQVSVAGLAKVFGELGENGSLGVHQLTNTVLAAASGFDSLDGVVAEALSAIDNFDPGLNETDVIDFSEKAYKTLTENFEKGYWGNSQNFEYLDFFFGPDWDEGSTGDALKAKMRELTNIIGEGEEGYKKAWTNILGQEGFSQFNNMSSDEIVGKIMEKGYSEQYAQMLLTYMKNISPEFAAALKTTDLRTGLDNAFTEANVANDQKVLDASEISAIADMYGVAEDKVRQYFENRGALITNIYDKDGILKETDEIIKEIEKIYGEDTKGKWTLSDDGSMARERLISIGVTNKEDQDRILDEYYAQKVDEAEADENGKKSITVSEKTSYGTTTELTITPEISYSEAMANAEARALADIYAEAFGETLGTTGVDALVNFDSEQVRSALQGILAEPFEATVNLSSNGLIVSSNNNSGFKSYGTQANYAKGIKDSPSTHDALVSEEGPELIQRADGTAYLSGLNGPEITKIHRGDTVYTAEETRQIFSNKSQRGIMPRFSVGQGMSEEDAFKDSFGNEGDYIEGPILIDIENPFNNKPGGDDDIANQIDNLSSEAKTSLDKLYNLLAQIEETTRQRERLERRYEALIKDTNSSIKDVVDNSKAQLAVLEAEKELQESLIKGRQAQIEAYTAQNAGYAQYAGVETNAYGDQVMRIDWDAINAISNDDERKKVEEYISKLEGWLDELTEAENALWDIEDAVEEINERGKEEYLDLEEQIKEALISERQEEIDKLSAIDESINNANSSMMQAIQDTLSQQRQERDNAKTEEELAEKERRLQYLKQDTSGANALEIMELEKELAEGREDYTDTLIDQKIQELQKQNDQAAEQRQKQIDILSKQLEMYEKSDELWNKVHSLMETGIDDDGIRIGSSLHKLFEHYITKDGLSAIGEQKWWSDLDATIKNGMAWLQTGQQIENLSDKPEGEIPFKVGDQEFIGTVQSNGDVKTAEGAVYTEVYRGANGKYYTSEGKKEPPKPESEKPEEQKPSTPDWYEKLKNIGYVGYGVADGDDVEAVEMALKELGYWDDRGTIDKHFDSWTDHAIRKFQLATIGSADGQLGSTTKTKLIEAAKKKLGLTQFKTGGVADFTGPAWLDGTKSRPEIILNQQDSRNFIQLKDILSSILKGNHYSSSSTENNGDTVYDIDINVEKLEREVDLDTISNYVERKITETARYRNNNAVKISR